MPGIDKTTNEWRVRQTNPGQYDKYARKSIGGGVSLVLGIKNGKSETQSVRFAKDSFPDKESVKAWINKHDQYHMTEIEECECEKFEECELSEPIYFAADFSTIELDEGQNPKWIMAVREGEFDNSADGSLYVCTEKKIDGYIKNFYANVRGLYFDKDNLIPTVDIDFAHKKDPNYGEQAAGWVGDLEKRDYTLPDGRKVKALWMKPRIWTAEGQSAIRGDKFKYFSGDFRDVWYNPDNKKTYKDVMFGGGLTNRPSVKEMPPLTPAILSEPDKTNGQKPEERKELNMKKLLKILNAMGITQLSETSTAEYLEDKAVDVITNLSERNGELSRELSELKTTSKANEVKLSEMTEKVKGIELAEETRKKEVVEKLGKEKCAASVITDQKSFYNILLAERKYEALTDILKSLPKGYKDVQLSEADKGEKNEESEDDAKTPWDKLDSGTKTKKTNKVMDEMKAEEAAEKGAFAKAAKKAQKMHDAKYTEHLRQTAEAESEKKRGK
jgi:hypothetical protein